MLCNVSTVKELTESVVFHVKFYISMETNNDLLKKIVTTSKLQFHARALQFYTTEGLNLKYPVQILEAAEVVMHFNKVV